MTGFWDAMWWAGVVDGSFLWIQVHGEPDAIVACGCSIWLCYTRFSGLIADIDYVMVDEKENLGFPLAISFPVCGYVFIM